MPKAVQWTSGLAQTAAIVTGAISGFGEAAAPIRRF